MTDVGVVCATPPASPASRVAAASASRILADIVIVTGDAGAFGVVHTAHDRQSAKGMISGR